MYKWMPPILNTLIGIFFVLTIPRTFFCGLVAGYSFGISFVMIVINLFGFRGYNHVR